MTLNITNKFSGIFFSNWTPLLLILLSSLFLSCNSDGEKNQFKITKGIINLQQWSPARHGSIELSGTWKFRPPLWRHHLKKKIKPPEWNFIQVPKKWRSAGFDRKGLAIYRLIIQTGTIEEQLALRIRYISSAYQISLDGKLLGQQGYPSAWRNQELAKVSHKLWEIGNLTPGEHILEIVASNFNYSSGGIHYPIEIGKISHLYKKHLIERGILIGTTILSLFFCCYSFLLLYFSPRQEEFFPLGVMCLMTAIFTITRGYLVDEFYSGGIPYTLNYELLYTTLIIIPMCQISMAEKFLNIPVKMVDQLLYVLGLVWLAFQWLLWDVCIISEYLFILLLLICFFYIRTMMICFKAIRFRFPDSKVLLLGFTFLFAGIVAESMASQQLFYFSNSAQIGFTLMAFVLLITITRRHGIAIKFTRVARENLAMEMKERRKEVTMLHEQIAEKNLQIKKLKKRGQKSPARHE